MSATKTPFFTDDEIRDIRLFFYMPSNAPGRLADGLWAAYGHRDWDEFDRLVLEYAGCIEQEQAMRKAHAAGGRKWTGCCIAHDESREDQ